MDIIQTTLGFIATVSLLLTPIAVFYYIFYRLVVYLRRTGPAGLLPWFSETKALLLGVPIKLEDSDAKAGKGSKRSKVSGDAGLILLLNLPILLFVSLLLLIPLAFSYIFYRLAVYHPPRRATPSLKALLLGGAVNLLDSDAKAGAAAEGGARAR